MRNVVRTIKGELVLWLLLFHGRRCKCHWCAYCGLRGLRLLSQFQSHGIAGSHPAPFGGIVGVLMASLVLEIASEGVQEGDPVLRNQMHLKQATTRIELPLV